jgi:hypothetical protein
MRSTTLALHYNKQFAGHAYSLSLDLSVTQSFQSVTIAQSGSSRGGNQVTDRSLTISPTDSAVKQMSG